MFETYIYTPFFNILVGLYSILGGMSPEAADMGVAVIIFAIIVRLLTFPLTLAGERSEEEKRKILDKIDEAKRLYAHEPVRQKEAIRVVMRSNVRTVLATTTNIAIQLAIILMLYRLFNTGLGGKDFHLLYDFMPRPDVVNLVFLGKYDLSQPSAYLNFIQSVMIFMVEVLLAMRSPLAVPRRDKILLQIVLPIGSYIIFMFLPSGKILFVITSLSFSALYNTYKLAQDWGSKLMERITPKATDETELRPPPTDKPTN